MSDKPYQLVLFGATSFVGRIVFQYLLEHYSTDKNGTDQGFRWAVAARSKAKLAELQQELGATYVPTIIADSSNPQSLQYLCQQTDLVISTVGPYALYGEPLVKLCAEMGVDYCDLTGEIHWVKAMIDNYQTQAVKSGARIIPSCGFDSIPSDLGVFFLQQQAQERFGEPCEQVKFRIKAMRGSFSGGTVASMLNVSKAVVKEPALAKILRNPYSLCERLPTPKLKQQAIMKACFDEDFRVWLAPFIMATINVPVVFRSNGLQHGAYGEKFEYGEAVMTGQGPMGWLIAQSISAAMAGFFVASAIPPSRWLMSKLFLPAPGEGPAPEAQEKGFYDIRLLGKTPGGNTIRTKVTGDRDPGYGSTAKMLAEAAICLSQDISKSRLGGGFWTPASAFGDTLIKRLIERAGLTFEVIP